MANEPEQVDPTAAQPAPEAPARKRPLIIVAVVGLVLGIGGGAMLLHPMLAKSATGEASPVTHASATPLQFHSIDNLVVNPAGTNGTRFLLVSASIEVADDDGIKQVREHEMEIRDRMVTLLGSKTISQLTDPGARDSLKVELRRSIASLFPPGIVRNVYFPQYVLQ